MIKPGDDVLRYCAELCSFDHGDARRALELLLVAGQVCKKEVTKKDIDLASEYVQKDRVLAVLSSSSKLFRIAFVSLARLVYLTDVSWHSTSDVYSQYKARFVPKDGKSVSYRRFSDILRELEQTGLAASDTASKGRYGMNSRFCLAVPVIYISDLFPKIWAEFKWIKGKRFEMMHNPKYRGTNHDAKFGRCEDQKTWHKILGNAKFLDEEK